MAKLAGMTLAPDKQALAGKAKTFYAAYDFLDAYRLALAASQWGVRRRSDPMTSAVRPEMRSAPRATLLSRLRTALAVLRSPADRRRGAVHRGVADADARPAADHPADAAGRAAARLLRFPVGAGPVLYGVSEANLYGNLIYTAENVAMAVAVGSVIGVLAGLVSARFGLVRAVIDPVVMTAGTVPILVAAPFC